MKTLFVFPSSSGGHGINEYTEQPPLGIGYLAAALEEKGFSSDILDANFLNYDVKSTVSFIKEKKPGVVCLSLYAFNFEAGLAVAEAVKAAMPKTVIIAGGAHPSAVSEHTLKTTNAIDAVIIGEGELTLIEIMDRFRNDMELFSGVDGVAYTRDGSIIRNNPRAQIDDLDTVPFPAFHLYPDLSRYHRRAVASPAVPILTSRGCPFECVFCAKNVFGRKIRYRSVKNVLAEIDYLVEKFKVRQLDVVDDNFITNKNRAIDILQSLCRKPYKLAINMQSGVSAKLVDRDILKLMKKAGVYRIALGVESGNQRILDLIKKGQKLEDVVRAVDLTKKEGIRADAFFMIGLPGETHQTMQDTIDFAKRIDPHTANFHMVVPFPGTELYEMVARKGHLIKKTSGGIKTGYNYPEAYYEIGELKKDDIEKYYKKAYKEFYFRPGKIIKTVFSIRSIEEFIWLLKTGLLVIFSMFTRKKAKTPLILPDKGHYNKRWGDEELDLLSRLVYHPIYGLLYRHRYKLVLSLIPKCETLLEIGCGHGLFLPSLLERAEAVHALDIHPYLGKVKSMMEKDGFRKTEFTRGDVLHLPYKDESFDSIVCMSVLEHMDDIEKAAFELWRILKKDGLLIVGFPIKNNITRSLFKLIGRDDSKIHPQSHRSIIGALNNKLIFKKEKVFPPFNAIDFGFYYVGEYKKNG